MKTHIDNTTLRKIRSGNKRILEKIFDQYFDEIFRFISFRTPQRAEAEDLASKVFLQFFEYVLDGNIVKEVRGFLYTVARNEIARYFRTQQTVSLDEQQEEIPGSVSEQEINAAIDFELDIDQAKQVLNNLRADWREVVILRFLEEQSYKEIAKTLDKSEGAVRVMLHRAIQEIRKYVSPR